MFINQPNLDDDDSDQEDDDGNIFDVFIADDEGDDQIRYKLTVFIFATSQIFFTAKYFEDKKKKPCFFADYFICSNFDKNI